MESMKRIPRKGLLAALAGSIFVLAFTGCSYLPELPDLPDLLPCLSKDENHRTEKTVTAPQSTMEAKPKLASTSPKPVAAKEPTLQGQSSFLVHTVKWPRETLSIIAKWYTGDFDHWKELGEANPHIVPHRIHVNDRILIPENLLKTRNSMPQSFVDKYTPRPAKKPAVSKKPSPQKPTSQTSTAMTGSGGPEPKAETKQPEPKEPELFGPKEYSGR